MADHLISVRNLSKSYGRFTALNDVSLDVREGECVALLGPSGCGKTTLLRSIAGFVTPDSGSVVIDGASMSGRAPNRRPVNMVFQNYALFPHLTVRANIAFGPNRRGLPKTAVNDAVDRALSTIGMSELADRYPAQLSGGQQQRVALARAIVNEPRALLLDEPLGALDLKLRKRMQLELKHLRKRLGITFLFVTHDQEEALVMADRIAVMDKGSILQIGTGEEIYSRPASRFVGEFIGEANFLSCSIAAGGGLIASDGKTKLPYVAAAGATAASLLLRPEDIEIGSSKDSEAIEVPGRVKECVFVGSGVRVYVEVFAGDLVMVEAERNRETLSLQIGQPITMHWSAHSGIVFSNV